MQTRWLAVTMWVMAACGGMPDVPVPVGDEPQAPEVVLVWVGRGEAERQVDGQWQRAPAFDYSFTVEQRRYAGRWRSYKTMRRLHPSYDGSAGPREQVLWFEVAWSDGGGDRSGVIRSGLGDGTVTSDREFRRSAMSLRPEISVHAPFDTYRITQHYRYEEGRLDEVVELVDHDDGREVPWVRNTERAELFSAGPLPGPPTR